MPYKCLTYSKKLPLNQKIWNFKAKMASFRSFGGLLSGYSSHGSSSHNNAQNYEDVVKEGYLAKRKNMKNRYFVLRRKTQRENARLEYYDSKRKFLDGCQPKKKYILKECFSISRKTDRDHCVIALYINKDCIALVSQDEAEMQEWLQKLQQHKNTVEGGGEGVSRIDYEHVWQVDVLSRSLADTHNLTGKYWLCLTNRLLSLVKMDDADRKQEFQLNTIRKCGFLGQFFFLQLGRLSGIGCGDLYMQTEDSFIAQNIHNIVGTAMNNYQRTPSRDGMSALDDQSNSGNDNQLRDRTQSVSNPLPDGPLLASRGRSGSVPTKPRTHSDASTCIVRSVPPRSHFIRSPLDPEKRPQSIPGSNDSFGSSLGEESNARQPTPDRELLDFEGDFSEYVPMEPNDIDSGNSYHSLNSPRSIFNCLRKSVDYEDQSEYVSMDVDTPDSKVGSSCVPPNSLLGLSPRTTHNMPGHSSGTLTPVSPSSGVNQLSWGQYRGSQLSSPQASSGSHSAAHSRSSSLLDGSCDGYMQMLPPISSSTSLSPAPPPSTSPNPYLEMGPGTASGQEKSTPIPMGSSDGDSYHEMFPNSCSSSCTSGTPSSDQKIHEFIGERGISALGGLEVPSNFSGSDDTDSLEARPIRTSSVGSKPDQYKRKNRLDAVSIGEPARVRAFSVGSRVSLKFGVGRLGTSGSQQGSEPPVGCLGELFPSIKETGKQAKNKSTSAPMLGASSVSHSWSGTPGSYFRGFIQNRNQPRETNLMELDFSKNKSYDFIPFEEKERDKKSSKERLWHTFTGHRHRSNSKSSGGSNPKDKRVSESEACSRGVEIPLMQTGRNDYFELDFNPSPRGGPTVDPSKGYLPMHPPSNLSSSLTNGNEFIEKRGPRHLSLNEPYLEMSSSLSSCASQDGYVDMTGGGSSGALTIASSSSSSNSLNCVSGRIRRSSNVLNPMSSQELPSPLEDVLDLDPNCEGLDFSRKKSKKSSKRKSFKESVKKKKSDSGSILAKSFEGDSPEFPHKNKVSGTFSTFTNLISRKPSTTKAPLSPKGSPLPKSARESSSPFSSLKRSKSKESKEATLSSSLGQAEEREPTSPSVDNHRRVPSFPLDLSNSSKSPPNMPRRKLSDTSDHSCTQLATNKNEEKMLFSPSEAIKLLRPSKKEQEISEDKRVSAYMNLSLAEDTSGSLPSLNNLQRIQNKPCTRLGTRSYVNMQPGSSSPQLSPPPPPPPNSTNITSPSLLPSSNVINEEQQQEPPSSVNKGKPTEDGNYMLMGGEGGGGGVNKEVLSTHNPPIVTRRPEIPAKLLSSHISHTPPLGLEKLTINEHGESSISERSRSHSGPGAPESRGTSEKNDHTKAQDGRAASACNSPISYSPPTSPTLGSVSSMSSLSEGGLSSASSTCTVVNVGVTRQQNQAASATKATQPNPPSEQVTTSISHEVKDASTSKELQSSISCSVTTDKSLNDNNKNTTAVAPCSMTENEEALNYVSLDLCGGNNKKGNTSPRTSCKNAGNKPLPSSDEVPLSYVEIDFNKSEGLRNTSIARDSKRPH